MQAETIEPLFLAGEYEILVDDKGRFSVPVDLREAIYKPAYGESLIVIIGLNKKPWLYPDRYYRNLLSYFTPQGSSPEELLKLDHFNVSMTFPIQMDKQGRTTLPEKIVQRTGVSGEVILAGARDHIEIWPRIEWEQYYDTLKANPNDVALQARLAMSQRDLAQREKEAAPPAA